MVGFPSYPLEETVELEHDRSVGKEIDEINYYSDEWSKLKQEHFVGNIVRFRVAEDVIPEDEIVCDEGVIMAAFYFHYWHPDIKIHRIDYDVVMPKEYWGSFGRKLRVGQTQIIENKTLGWKK